MKATRIITIITIIHTSIISVFVNSQVQNKYSTPQPPLPPATANLKTHTKKFLSQPPPASSILPLINFWPKSEKGI